MAGSGLPTSITAAISVTEPLFQRGSAYHQHRPGYPQSLFEWIARQSHGHDRALDLGCGTGQACRGLEPLFEQVLGADFSLKQLQAAPRSATHFFSCSASALPLPDASLDLITVAQAFHWFDPECFFAEAERCLLPGGMLVLISYGLCEVEGLGSLIREYHDGPLGVWWPPERAALMNHYPEAVLPWESVPYPDDALQCQWALQDMLGYLDTWSALVNARQAGEDPLADFAPALSRAWGQHTRTVRWPLRVKAWYRPPARS